jgi:transcription elongation factor/antiterminator RfaH
MLSAVSGAVDFQIGATCGFYGGSPSRERPVLHSSATITDPQATNLPWFALQVRSRKERLVETHLRSQGYECLLPLYKSARKWSDRVKEVEQPLFPGYLFCRFDFQNRRPLIVTPGVLQIVGIGKTATPIADVEVSAIQLAQASGLPSQPWPYIEVGERVRVNYGTLQGLEGILINFKGNHRVVLSVTLLQRSVAMEVDLSWVTSLEPKLQNAANRLAPRTESRLVTTTVI